MSGVYTGNVRKIHVNGVVVEARRVKYYLRTFHWAGDFFAWKMGWDFFIDGKFFDGGHSGQSGLGTQSVAYRTLKDFECWGREEMQDDWRKYIERMERRAAREVEGL
jgi:hypothetical protein